MKKILFILGMLFSVAFLYAQEAPSCTLAPENPYSVTTLDVSKPVFNRNASMLMSRGSVAYMLIHSPQAQQGYYKFDVDNINGRTLITKTISMGLYGGAYYDHKLYTFDCGQEKPCNYQILDPYTGDVLASTPRPELFGQIISAVVYDYSTNAMYAVSSNVLYSVTIATGALTKIGNITGIGGQLAIAFAINLDGTFYLVTTSMGTEPTFLYTVNKTTGVATSVGSTGRSKVNYAQSMAFDHSDGTLYWLNYEKPMPDAPAEPHFLKINTSNGTTTLIQDVDFEALPFFFPYDIDNPCEPATNLKAKYVGGGDECKTELTWDAPAKGSFKYAVYRDGDEIATVETESYTDDDFEPTLEHVWSVKVICEDGVSSEIYASIDEPCLEANCAQPKNFSVTVNDKCEATLKWNAPTDVLFDNTDQGDWLYVSTRWLQEEYQRGIIADDFDVPEGEIWNIAEVYIHGSYRLRPPDYFGIEIFMDNGNGDLPGDKIYEDSVLMPIGNNMSSSYQTIPLSKPFVINEKGKYWVSCYGVFDGMFEADLYYFTGSFLEPRGAQFARLDEEEGGAEWQTFYPSYNETSMYFRLQGHLGEEPIYYNVYRDNALIAEKITDLSFVDKGASAGVSHKWKVKVACPDGGESAAVIKEVACGNSVNENVTLSFTIAPNPARNTIKITANNNFKAIEVINFLGQTVISQPNVETYQTTLDVSNLPDGIYFVRIATDNGTSVQKFVKQ